MLTDQPGDVQDTRSQRLQRRVIRLLLHADMPLFRGQFRLFFAKSALPDLPLLRHYDRYIKGKGCHLDHFSYACHPIGL
ncbi:hypothetical protein KSF_096740 [Reticulibacter mediterranei]|uniref:Uncharacterized protein n=1 Tax=Reticulibacter mediterranei TaxID=2778369 RepID=A0A8J3IRV6_9CHLR|nr:hypothetical protein [Reticulibacter mediterranei]GHO99626.1 hypothetical protein KSF_096740 [Reticulibacter mediterranei]